LAGNPYWIKVAGAAAVAAADVVAAVVAAANTIKGVG
jgi:hypothetical protein